MKRLERLVTLALYLSARRRVRARQVAEEFGISLRTVYRDVKALESAGFPVAGTAGDGYQVSQDSFLRPLQLSSEEAEALMLAAGAVGATLDDPLRSALRGAVAKLESTLDRAVQRRTRDLLARTRFVAQEERGPALTGAVLTALRERRTLRVAYRDPRTGVRTRRVVEPLGLVCPGDAWWLLAYCRLRGDARIFRLDRIASCEEAGETFEPRDGFSFAEVLQRDRALGREILGC